MALTKQGVFDLIKQGYDPKELGHNGGKKAAANRKQKRDAEQQKQAADERVQEMWWNK